MLKVFVNSPLLRICLSVITWIRRDRARKYEGNSQQVGMMVDVMSKSIPACLVGDEIYYTQPIVSSNACMLTDADTSLT